MSASSLDWGSNPSSCTIKISLFLPAGNSKFLYLLIFPLAAGSNPVFGRGKLAGGKMACRTSRRVLKISFYTGACFVSRSAVAAERGAALDRRRRAASSGMKKSNGAPHFQKKKKHQKKHFEPSWSPNARARARLKRPPEQEAAVITVTTLANEAASNSIKVSRRKKSHDHIFPDKEKN
jgi:hypothetical protein